MGVLALTQAFFGGGRESDASVAPVAAQSTADAAEAGLEDDNDVFGDVALLGYPNIGKYVRPEKKRPGRTRQP